MTDEVTRQRAIDAVKDALPALVLGDGARRIVDHLIGAGMLAPTPHLYRAEVLANIDQPNERWCAAIDGEEYASIEEARADAGHLVDEGHRPDTIRIAAITLVP